MTVTVKTLIQVAPFPQAEREMLLAKYDSLTDEQKVRISEASWRALSIQYFSALETEEKLLLLEIQEGKRKYNPNDFEEVKARLFYEFSQKLQTAQTKESIEEVRTQLEKYKTKSFTQDSSSSSSQQK